MGCGEGRTRGTGQSEVDSSGVPFRTRSPTPAPLHPEGSRGWGRHSRLRHAWQGSRSAAHFDLGGSERVIGSAGWVLCLVQCPPPSSSPSVKGAWAPVSDSPRVLA